MNYRRLGKTGLKVSELSYGSWVTFSFQIGQKKVTEMLKLAYDGGINFFDNAEAYASGESEKLMGKAIKDLGWGRDTYIVSSKVFWGGQKPTQNGLSHKHIRDACHAALKRLKVEYLDLFFCHRPDPDTPIEETVRAMHTLILQGKICYWGTSEWSYEQIAEAYKIAKELSLTPPSMEQPEYNMFNRIKIEKEFLPLFKKHQLGTTIWSPLCSGLLTGKYIGKSPKNTRTSLKNYKFIKDSFESDKFSKRHDIVKKLKILSEEINVPLVNLSLCWCLKNKNVSTVILGASKISQLKQNLKTLGYMDSVDNSVLKRIEGIIS
jgi:voltage-dependent potassium channel beta subunit